MKKSRHIYGEPKRDLIAETTAVIMGSFIMLTILLNLFLWIFLYIKL